MMRREDRLFTVFPKILPVGKPVRITIRPKYSPAPARCRITIKPTEGKGREGWVQEGEASAEGIKVEMLCDHEQEYALTMEDAHSSTPVGEFHFYAVADDLHPLTPWKGDFHMHSTRSDGKEEPPYVAAACRRIGMDFMALTDHGQYEPSQEAIRAFRDRPIDLAIFPGEEVHPPGVSTHILHLGGSQSINALFGSAAFKSEVAARASALAALPAGVRDELATCEWCFDRIRACGGVGILAHPYWVFKNTYNVPEPLLGLFFKRRPFDALEVIGGYNLEEVESNALQVARWQEESASGKHIPVVGVSDAHGCETGRLFGWYYTVVFSATLRFADLAGAIRGMRSVAVEAMPGAPPKVYGPFRLAKLAHYLLREVFPLHDEPAFEEGKLMLALVAGEPGAEEGLRRLQGQVAGLYSRLWGRPPGQSLSI